MSFNDLFYYYRTQTGLTQEQLANKLSVTANYISKLERKTCQPSIQLSEKMLKIIMNDKSPCTFSIQQMDSDASIYIIVKLLCEIHGKSLHYVIESIYKIIQAVSHKNGI